MRHGSVSCVLTSWSFVSPLSFQCLLCVFPLPFIACLSPSVIVVLGWPIFCSTARLHSLVLFPLLSPHLFLVLACRAFSIAGVADTQADTCQCLSVGDPASSRSQSSPCCQPPKALSFRPPASWGFQPLLLVSRGLPSSPLPLASSGSQPKLLLPTSSGS